MFCWKTNLFLFSLLLCNFLIQVSSKPFPFEDDEENKLDPKVFPEEEVDEEVGPVEGGVDEILHKDIAEAEEDIKDEEEDIKEGKDEEENIKNTEEGVEEENDVEDDIKDAGEDVEKKKSEDKVDESQDSEEEVKSDDDDEEEEPKESEKEKRKRYLQEMIDILDEIQTLVDKMLAPKKVAQAAGDFHSPGTVK